MAGLGTNVGTNFFLRSRMNGSVTLVGKALTTWYFTDGSGMRPPGFLGDRDLPSTHFEPIEGQSITLDFQNSSMMDHTIHLHGLDVDQQNDGVPATSFAVPPMGRYTYQFVAPHAGTYHYHCHVDTVLHYARGMFGAVIVRPPDASTSRAWDGGPSFDEEVLWQLHTVDTAWFNEQQSGPATCHHRPDAFLINGLESAAARTDPFSQINLTRGQVAYLRLVNSGYQWARVDLGGLPFRVVASDGRPMRWWPRRTSWELGPGERYDLLIRARSKGTWTGTVAYLDDYSGQVLGTADTRVQVT